MTSPQVAPALRNMLLALAALFLGWEILGTLDWLERAGSVRDGLATFLEPLRRDRMQQIVTSDFLLVGAIVLMLLWLDAARRGWGISRRSALALGFIALGSPVLLTYIALRSDPVRASGGRPAP